MKKLILGMFMMTMVIFAAGTDGIGGASLNEKNTIVKYKELTKMANSAIKDNDWFMKERAVDEIENFIMVIDSYADVSSKAAKKDTEKYKVNLNKKLDGLKNVDGMGGASLDPKKMMPRYNYVDSMLDNALKTGKNEEKAIEKAENLLKFIKTWKSGQSVGAKSYLDKYEESLTKKIGQLKK